MARRSVAVCLSLVALTVFALPSSALAAALTEEGKVVPVGASILATNTENIIFTSVMGNLACATGKMTGKLIKNDGSTVQVTISSAELTGTGTESRCTSTIFGNPQFKVDMESLPWCLESEAAGDSFTLKGEDCTASEGSLKMTWTSSLGNCTFEKTTPATTPFTGTFVTDTTPAVLRFDKETFTRTAGTLCPVTTEMKSAFTLETDSSPFTSLTIS